MLDLGCMFGEGTWSLQTHVPIRIGVDLCDAYFEHALDDGASYFKCDVLEFAQGQPDQSFDLVLLIDVLEHLEKGPGNALLREMLRITRRRAIVFTPDGFVEQYADDSAQKIVEAYGTPMIENPLQKHLSGWTRRELADFGFDVSTKLKGLWGIYDR